MNFDLTEDQKAIADAVRKICSKFTDEYWSRKDTEAEFPHEFHAAMAADGWLGITMPEELGGSSLGVTEAAVATMPPSAPATRAWKAVRFPSPSAVSGAPSAVRSASTSAGGPTGRSGRESM